MHTRLNTDRSRAFLCFWKIFQIFFKNIACFAFPCVVSNRGANFPALAGQEGGKHMKPHSQQQEQQKQTFEHFCKQILKNEKNDYHRRLNYRQEHEVLFCELPPSTVEQLSVSDKYFQDTYLFQIKGFEVAVADELLGEALKTLPQDRLEIILLSYFLDMSDPEIAAHLNLIRRTVSHRRKNTLRKLKKIMEGYDDE